MTPTIETARSKAWKVDFTKNPEAGDHATVALWVVEARWAHPAWHSYTIATIHLRPMKDARPTKIYLAGATHEIWVLALDPRGDTTKLIEGGGVFGPETCLPLRPMNFAAQFIVDSDAEAARRTEEAVRDVCDGKLSPDTDYIRHWGHRFGFNMMKLGAGETKVVEIHDDGTATPILTIPPRKAPQDHN